MEEQTLYLYQILDHGHVIHTSQCFPSLRRAVECFYEYDKPRHFASGWSFKRSSCMSAALKGTYKSPGEDPRHVYVIFRKVELKVPTIQEWDDVVNR